MTYQHDLKQVAPEPARRLQGQAVQSAALPYHTAVAGYDGRGAAREGANMMGRANNSLRPEEVYYFNHDEHDHASQEATHYQVLAPKSEDHQLAESHAPMCACDHKCKCKPACTYQIHACPCAPCLPQQSAGSCENAPPSRSFENARPEIQHAATGKLPERTNYPPRDARADHSLLLNVDRARQVTPHGLDKAEADRSFSNGKMPKQNPQATRAPRRKEVNVATTSTEPMPPKRQRAPTVNNSDLVYVPPAPTKTPARKQKDATPLALYGTNGSLSGQRYPTFNMKASLSKTGIPTPPVFATVSSTSGQDQSMEPIAQTLMQLSSNSSERKPRAVQPIPLSALRLNSPAPMSEIDEDEREERTPSPLSAPRQRRFRCNKTYAAITGEVLTSDGNIDEYHQLGPIVSDEPVDPPPATVTYPAIPRSTSAGLFNPGTYVSTVTQSFPSAQAGNPRDPEGSPGQGGVQREDWYDHGDGYEHAPTRHSSPATTRRGFPPPLPKPLPLPDFIAPRPATKQRYVSAGGNAKLEDRPEITDFVLSPSVTPGIAMQRDVLLQHLNNVPQFGTPTRSMTIGSPMPSRGSEEVLRVSSTRTSYEDGVDLTSTKRDRKESGSSQRIARFKRVFSFGKEGKDKDSKETSPGK